jgi:hypothetical protein
MRIENGNPSGDLFAHYLLMKRETVDIVKRLLYPEAPLVEKELPCHE